jgi:hypothetical protein
MSTDGGADHSLADRIAVAVFGAFVFFVIAVVLMFIVSAVRASVETAAITDEWLAERHRVGIGRQTLFFFALFWGPLALGLGAIAGVIVTERRAVATPATEHTRSEDTRAEDARPE